VDIWKSGPSKLADDFRNSGGGGGGCDGMLFPFVMRIS
jgi:hypothetical protein